MQKTLPTLEQLSLEIQSLKAELAETRQQHQSDMDAMCGILDGEIAKERNALNERLAKEHVYYQNTIADIHLLLTELSKQQMPKFMNFECDVQDITGVPDFKAPERFKRAPKLPTEKTNN